MVVGHLRPGALAPDFDNVFIFLFTVRLSLSLGWFILATPGDLLPRVQTWCLPHGQAQAGGLSPTSSE